jgi:hypothetical protein
MLVTFSLPEFNLKKQMYTAWEFHVDDHSESSSTYAKCVLLEDFKWMTALSHQTQML